MKNKQKETSCLKKDIDNATKFFDRTGEGIKEAYKCVDKDIDSVNPDTGTQNIFLYIPNSDDDIYKLYLN
jgi:hypothetical protein